MTNGHDTNVAGTYLALRLGMVLLVGLLFVSVALQIIEAGCLQLSLSAYYFTPARPVFVGSLAAIGACLIIYRGNTDTENVLLDYSGFLAFVVAFVPTRVDLTCPPVTPPPAEEISQGVRNNVWALLAMGAATILVAWWRVRRQRRMGDRTTMNPFARMSLALSAVALLTLVAFFAFWPDEFERYGHDVAAVALFVGIVAVVLVNAWGFDQKEGTGTVASAATNRYSLVAIVMVVAAGGILLAGLLIDAFDNYLFFLEAALISGFAAFWLIQTWELRGEVSRSDPVPGPSAR